MAFSGNVGGSLARGILISYSLSIFFKHGSFYDLSSEHRHTHTHTKIFAKWKEREDKHSIAMLC